VILAVAIAVAVATFPYRDIPPAVEHPSPATILKLAADVATSVVPFYPQARIAEAVIPVAIVMAKHPARLPMREAQTAMGRGGRRS
jgi:hypothetical protein